MFTYNTKGTCSRQIIFDVDGEHKLHNVKFIGGCGGNLQGIARLVEGKDIDEVAGTVARRHAGSIVTTACVDNLNFKAGAYLGNTIVLIGRMTYVGRTSMEVRVDTYVEDMDGTRKMINRAYEVLVAIDQNDQKQEVPGLIIETETEKAEWLGGEKRYALRKQRRKEGY